MENIISTATQPLLLNSVDYKLGAVASYVTARESVVTAPMTGGQFGPTNPVMRLQVADSSAISFCGHRKLPATIRHRQHGHGAN